MQTEASHPFTSQDICKTLVKHKLLSSEKVKEILAKEDTVKKKLSRNAGRGPSGQGAVRTIILKLTSLTSSPLSKHQGKTA